MSSAPIPWQHVRNTLVLFAPLWVGAAFLFGLLGAGFAVFKSDAYTARLPLVVRDEATRSIEQLGRFASPSDLKAAQETILEMAQNPEVVEAALRKIGPPPGESATDWPNAETIDQTATKQVNLLAPKGSEFGNTEVVYLQVKAESQTRANEFCQAMFASLTEQLRMVRRVRADSLIAELKHTRELAKQNLDEANARLHEIEVAFGTDLGELRNLNDTISGDGTNRRTLEETTRELQSAELELGKLQSLHQLLVAGSQDPQQLLISGSDLLASQPSLQRLKEGLIDAQLTSSRLAGIYTPENPKMKAAIAAEQEIQTRMQAETAEVIRAMAPMIRLQEELVGRLTDRESQLRERLNHLATARTEYAKIDSEVTHRTSLLADADRALSEAMASRTAALSTSLIAELGPPQVTEKPVGPSGLVITGGSTAAGILFGLGVVFLIAPGPSDYRTGRRWSDYLSGGRRSSDHILAGRAGIAIEPSGEATRDGDRRRAISPPANE
jgi:uncharacterized protein involved in exopolysaccharide biosynthesis